MILKNLELTDFKNIESARLDLSPKINCFLGNNGMGKSNLLDALYFMSLCRSFTGAADGMMVRRGAQFATMRGKYFRRGLDEEVSVVLKPGQRKVFKRSGKAYQRLAEHLGLFPVVLLSPSDMDLTAGEPADRRRFIDQIISQRDARYFDALVRYNAALEQRNRLLRDESNDTSLFEALEIQMEMNGGYIAECRKATVGELQEIFTPYFTTDYSDRGGLAEHLAAMRRRDTALGHTASGPHRDDIVFTVNDMPVRRSASQGQSKTFTTALRFAQYDLLRKSLGIRPLLLLDDIFDKLDAGRVERIIGLVSSSESFGQIFITDTNRRHLDETVANLRQSDSYGIWGVERGVFTSIQA